MSTRTLVLTLVGGLAAVAMALLFRTTMGGAGPVPTVRFVKNPVAVPDFTVTDLNGRSFTMSSLRGKAVLVNFWATWCGPCRAEIPGLVALQQKYRNELVILGVSTDEAPPDRVAAFAREHGMNYPIVMETEELRRAFPGVFALPTTFVVDPKGRTVQKHVGLIDVSTYEDETRALTGLVKAKIEEVDDNGKVLLANAALATEIPGIDLSPLSPDARKAVLETLNRESCTCGCALTLAQCRINDSACNVSLPIAQGIVKKAVGGGSTQ
jgi:thiol-disulfide isomerase/thioredoxin